MAKKNKKKNEKKTSVCPDCEGWGYWEYPTISRVAKVPCKLCNHTGKVEQ